MAVVGPSREAAARRRRGAIARAAFAARLERRRRAPRRPGIACGQAVPGVGVVARAAPPSPPSSPMAAYRRCPGPPRDTACFLGRLDLAAAESRAAPEFYQDLVEAGSALLTVRSRGWRSARLWHAAEVFARSLDLLVPAHAPAVWATVVCSLASSIFADICPAFDRVCSRAAGAGVFFPLVPLRGRSGWRRRARLAGFL